MTPDSTYLADPAEPAETDPDISGDELEDYDGEPLSVASNSGQVAHTVHGGMVQNNYVYRQMRRFHEYHDLGPEYVAETMASFVERRYWTVAEQPLSRHQAARLLDAQACVVLAGQPETGRHTAAVALLADLATRHGVRLREITGWNPAQPGSLTEDLDPSQRYGFLLQIPHEEESQQIDQVLHTYRMEMVKHASFLVLVTSREAARSLSGHHAGCVLRVDRPEGADVLRQEVMRLAPDGGMSDLAVSAEFTALAAQAPPREVARLAYLIKETVSTNPDGDHDTIGAVVSAYKNWDLELATWFSRHCDVRERLFLASAAVMETWPASIVLTCADDLGRFLQEQPSTHEGLGEPGIRQLAQSTGAKVREDGTLVFERAAYGPAVLDFLRHDRSRGFQDRFWNWTGQLPLRLSPRGRSSERLASRIADVTLAAALRYRDARLLRAAAVHWAPRRDLRPTLVTLLSAAALSPEAGSATREQLNRWATIPSTNPWLLCVIAEVCGGPMADAYPAAGLVRLNHLASRGTPVAEAVVEAVARMWQRPRLRPAVARQLASWMSGPQQSFDTACHIMARLSQTPEPSETLLAAVRPWPHGHRYLVDAIRLITGRDCPPGRAALTHWLAESADNPDRSGFITRAFAEAAAASTAPAQTIARLCEIAFDWCPVQGQLEKPAHRELRDRLVDALCRADPMVATHNSTTISEE